MQIFFEFHCFRSSFVRVCPVGGPNLLSYIGFVRQCLTKLQITSHFNSFMLWLRRKNYSKINNSNLEINLEISQTKYWPHLLQSWSYEMRQHLC